ncbi:MAG: tetratricopeptide repeat protein, partial [Blastocatellia bacterium]
MAPSQPLNDGRAQDVAMAGQIAMEESRFEEASEYFKRALRMGVFSVEEEALLRCQLSESFEKCGLYREALEAVSKYERMPEFIRLSDHAQMSTLIRLGWSCSFVNDIPKSIALFNQAMFIARRLDDDAGVGACCLGLGRAYRNLNELRIASDQYTMGLEHYRRIGDWRKLAHSYIAIGQIQAHEGDYRNALHSLKQALTIIGDREENDLHGRAYTYMAIIYDHQSLTNKALESWERAIKHFRLTNNLPLLAMNYNNLADKLFYLGDWKRAEELLMSAIEMLDGSTGVTTLGGVYDTLAQLSLLRGQIEEADRWLDESLKVLASIRSSEWVEVSTLITIGRSNLMKDQTERAIEVLSRAIEICEQSGDNHYISEARLYLSESYLRKGDLKQASALVETVRTTLNESAQTKWWGMMMRISSRIEAAQGFIAAAIQSLGQSTSIFEIKGSVYEIAVNRIDLAGLLTRQGNIESATVEVEKALEGFRQLGAAADERIALERLAALKQIQTQTRVHSDIIQPTPDLVSIIDGFMTRRLAQASVFRELLIQELASIIQQQANSKAALVAEVDGNSLRLKASVGLDEVGKREAIDFLSKLSPEERHSHFIYSFDDSRKTKYLLHIIAPGSERFLSGAISLVPLLDLVKLSLEVETQRSKSRRTQVFNPARLLEQVELPGFICASRAMGSVLEQIHKIRSSDVTVLITGESGTGKE